MSARARAREAAKERKEAEKLQRKEELRRLKALKRKEVEERLEKLLEAAGKGTRNLEEIDLDGEWDEKKHEEAMKKVYDEEYEGLEVRAPSPLPAVVVHSMLTHYGSVSGRGL
mgnify:FL=1